MRSFPVLTGKRAPPPPSVLLNFSAAYTLDGFSFTALMPFCSLFRICLYQLTRTTPPPYASSYRHFFIAPHWVFPALPKTHLPFWKALSRLSRCNASLWLATLYPHIPQLELAFKFFRSFRLSPTHRKSLFPATTFPSTFVIHLFYPLLYRFPRCLISGHALRRAPELGPVAPTCLSRLCFSLASPSGFLFFPHEPLVLRAVFSYFLQLRPFLGLSRS